LANIILNLHPDASTSIEKTKANSSIDLEETDLEEIASMAGGSGAIGAGSVGKPQRRERKATEEEVNEALNYLLQKLGV